MMMPDEIREGRCYQTTVTNGRKVIVRVDSFSTTTIGIAEEIAGSAGEVNFETKNVRFRWRYATVGSAWSNIAGMTLANFAMWAETEVPCN